MKSKKFLLTAILLAISGQIGLATPKAPLPEFKNKTDMGKSVQFTAVATQGFGNNSFYTGRPFDANQQEYLFKYRNYDSELQRWKTPDPSGFPDGANNVNYAPVPTLSLDYQGLRVVIVLTRTFRSDSTWYYAGTLNDSLSPGVQEFTANQGKNNASTTDDFYGTNGPLPLGTYNLVPRTDWAEGDTYPNGTPSITDAGANPGSITTPGGTDRYNLYVHGVGASDGCVTTNFANQITAAMNANIDHGGTTITITE